MQKVLLFSKSLDDARTIKKYIENELPYEVFLTFDNADLEWTIKNKTIQLLMLQTGGLVDADVQYIHSLRQNSFHYPALILTDAVQSANLIDQCDKHKIFFLERPFELRTLKGITRKLMVSKSVSQQVFRRYRTNLQTTVETFISGERIETQMFNLSRGGAYFELSQKPHFGIGDLLRLKVHLAEVDRDHQVHGRVVWTTPRGHAAGGYGLGVRFVKGSEVYRNLLEKV